MRRHGGRVAVMAVLLGVSAAGAVEAQGRLQASVTTAKAKVRQDASAESPVIGTLDAGATVDVLEPLGAWVRIALPAAAGKPPRVGFIASRLVQLSVAPAPPAAPALAGREDARPPERAPEPDPGTAGQSSTGDETAAAPRSEIEVAAKTLHESVHGGYVEDAAYWRQVAKVMIVLQHRYDQRYNVVSPVLSSELEMIDSIVPKKGKQTKEDIERYKAIATKAMAAIDAKGKYINWQQTLSRVEPERGLLKRTIRRAAAIAVFGVNPVGAIVGETLLPKQ